MRQGTRARRAFALLAAGAALGVAGCGGDDEETTTTTSSVETTTGATGASGATGAEGAGGTYTAEGVEAAFEDEGYAINDATDAALTTPPPEAAISLVEKGETFANGTAYVFKDEKDAKEAEQNLTPSGNLDRIVLGNVVVEASTEPNEGFPTAQEMADIVEQSG
jgi:ABC-type glycerol-3-phosphate transport system substrate-binding protein